MTYYWNVDERLRVPLSDQELLSARFTAGSVPIGELLQVRRGVPSRLRRCLRALPKRATQEPADHASGPEGECGAKRNGNLRDEPRLRRPGPRAVHRPDDRTMGTLWC
jgi:hypothetical protein